MEENNVKISFAKNINKLNFSSTISVSIDSNVNIKTILDINSYLYDLKVECGSGKAIVNGKIGLKVLYVDIDNITNTLTDSQSFSETFVDSSITTDCYINANNFSIVNNILSSDGILKINCDVSISPILYLNLGMNNNVANYENLIVKKSEIATSTMHEKISSSFEYTTNFETKDNINKILSHNAYFTPLTISSGNNVATIEGKIYSVLLYETTKNDEIVIRQIEDTFNIKTDVEIPNLSDDCILDLSFDIDKHGENIATEIEDNNSIVTITNKINFNGVCLKNVNIEIVDDLYSTDTEVEVGASDRDFIKTVQQLCFDEKVYNEITMSSEETAIDDILSNLHIVPEITNSYVKDDKLTIEGIISSHLVYIDENKDCKQKQLEIPFIITSSVITNSFDCLHHCVSVCSCNIKAKRGTIIEVEYGLNFNINLYEKETRKIVDNVSFGKALDFSTYDFQIFIAKPNETMWDLCKRIKTTPYNLEMYNKDLPLIMQGGEKIIVKRY